MANYYSQGEWEPWSLESYRRIAKGLDPNTGGQAYDAFNNQPVYSEAERQKAQSLVDQMEKAGVQYSFQLQGLQAPVSNSGTFGDLAWDFVSSPAFLTLAGGVAGVYGGAAGAAAGAGEGSVTGAAGELAAGGAAGGGGAAGTGVAAADAAWGVNPQSLGSGITTGAAGETGLTAGTAGQGLTVGQASGAASGSLAPGFFSAESAYPVVGGLTAGSGGSGATTGTQQAPTTQAQQTALERILSGNGTTQDYLTAFGQVAPSLLGMYASDRQADALGGLASQYSAMGAPYRDRLAQSYSDPTAFLKSPEVQVPVQMGTDAMARALSTQGNPAGSGTALHELQNYSANQLFGRLGQERDRLAGFGGLTAYNSAAPQAATNAIGAERGVYDALGYGIGQVTNPPKSLADILKSYNISQGLV